ncbi:MAG: hypothetical protein R3B06_29415 [Kofleriaceae bacterium]
MQTIDLADLATVTGGASAGTPNLGMPNPLEGPAGGPLKGCTPEPGLPGPTSPTFPTSPMSPSSPLDVLGGMGGGK